MRKLALLALLLAIPAGLFAARLTLRDGTSVNGRFISGSSDVIVFQDETGVRRRFNMNQVQSIDFDAVGSSSVIGNDRYGRNQTYSTADRLGSADRATDAVASLDAGTQISVRTDQDINSETATAGRTYPASITQDVMSASGGVAIPRGSEAQLVIREVSEGGTLSSGNLVLDLESVRINGRRYLVSAEDVKRSDGGIGANRRTAEMVGGGAALGTLLGAIAGGGKGAAIGAIAGAAAGGGVQVLTRGKEIKVPAETVLNFRLDQPLYLREIR